MPVLSPADQQSFDVSGTTFTALAGPSRGAQETASWRLHVSPGVAGTPHRVTREEIIVALAGRGQASVNGETVVLEAGSTLIIPASSIFALGNPFDVPFEAIAMFPVGGAVIVGEADPFTPPWAR